MKELLKRLKLLPKKKCPKFIAKDYDQVGTYGENIQWGFKEETGELTIIGTGELTYHNYYNQFPGTPPRTAWTFLDVRSISIYGVTHIGHSLFYHIPVTEITIGDSVTTIDNTAFRECDRLIQLHADSASYTDVDGVLFTKDKKTLVHYPFGRAQRRYTIPNGVTTIRQDAFRHCKYLTEISIPDSVTHIGDYAFYFRHRLTVYYSGTEEQWNNIEIVDANESLTSATIHFNS